METLRVSYSSLGTFSSCPRKFEFDKLYPKKDRSYEDNYAADVGKALHAAYQDYLIHKDTDRAILELMRTFPFEQEYSQPNDYRSFNAALSTLEEMFAQIRMDEYELALIKRPLNPAEQIGEFFLARAQGRVAEQTFTVPAIEVPFEIRFKGLMIPPCPRYPDGAHISLIGYIDAILRNLTLNRYRTMDIKTSRMNLNDPTPKYKFDNQQTPYGLVVDHVAGEAIESFEVLYLDCYVDLVEPEVKVLPFLRTRNDIMEWCTNKVLQFQQIAKMAAADFFSRTDNGCLFYMKGCRYLNPCQSRDRDMLNEWFLEGETPRVEAPYVPWIIVDVDVGV